MADYTDLDLLNIGNSLRLVNGEIKAALARFAGAPSSPELTAAANSLHAVQVKYDEVRSLYTDVYRAVYGTVPTGLSGRMLGALGFVIGIPLMAVLVAGAAVLWQLLETFQVAFRAWENKNLLDAGANPNWVAAGSMGEWLSDNLIWVAGGALALVLVLRR